MINLIKLNKNSDNDFLKNEKYINKTSIFNELNLIIKELETRDIYILDNYTRISFIAIKKDGFILKIDFLRVIIKKDSLYLLVEKNQELIQNFVISLINNNKKYKYFEFFILEEIFIYVINIFKNNLDKLIPLVSDLYKDHFNSIKNYDFFLNVQKKFIELEFRVTHVLELLNELSLNDEDMENLFLTRKEDVNNKDNSHEEMEILLENYQKRIQQILNDLKKYIKEIELMKSTITVVLANNRNDIALKSIHISVINSGISTAMLITSIYGMNLKNYIEDEDYFFIYIIFISGTVGLFVYYLLKFFLLT